MTMHERRKEPRITCCVPAQLTNSQDLTVHQAHTIDVSRGGSLIRSPIPLQAGSGLELRIDLGELCLSPVKGRVRRTNPMFYGTAHLVAVEFSTPSDSLVQFAQELVTQPEPQSP